MASEQAMALYRKLNSSGTAITSNNWREWERLASSAMKMQDFTPAGQSESLHDLANEVGIEIQALKSRASRPGAKDMMAGEDFAARLRSLITRFGFRPDEVNVSGRFGVGTISFKNQKGKATELVSKLRGAMKQSGVPESAITAREVQYPADEDGPAEHWGVVNVDFNKIPHSRPGAKDMMARSDGNYFVMRGYMDGMIMGERSFDTQQEAEFYGKRMLDHMKSQYPKAKKIAVDIDSMVKHAPGPKIKTLASRPGAKAKFKVEDRFYFGKGRKERFDRYGYEKMDYDRLVRESYHLKDSAEYAISLGRKDNELRQKMSALQKEFTRRGFTAAATVLDAALRKPFSRPGQPERFAITRQPGSCLYANNTGTDVSGYHSAIAKAIEKGGKFDSDFSDVFKLTRSPAGSVCLWSLTWA